MNRRRPLIRNLDADVHLELFLVAAVATILVIRFYLEVTHYPQLAGGALHIAHMLWGGLLMLVALVILLAFLGRDAARLAAVVGGVGFGAFIDEVGKFVTKDNDYFFEPAFAVIYVVFALVILAVQQILRRIVTPEESLLNALQAMEEIVVHDLDAREHARALALLDASDPANPLVEPLRRALARAALVPVARPGPYARLRRFLRSRYEALVARPRFRLGLLLFFVLQLGARIVTVLLIVFFPGTLPSTDGGPPAGVAQRLDQLGIADWGQLSSTAISAAVVAAGVAGLARSRRFAYRMFKLSVLLTIFLTQVFMFYEQQLSAIVGLGWNILLLIALQVALELESEGGAEDQPRR
jgi:hypothetical protein